MRWIKLLLPLMVILGTTFSDVTTIHAQGSVSYLGEAEGFIYEPGSDYSPTDLFPDLKNVMPGDRISQTITIKNDIRKKTKINVYLRVLGAQEGSVDFLSQLTMTVRQANDSIMYSVPAHQSVPLNEEEWMDLGTIYSGGEIVLEVTLDVPITLGNEFQASVGYLDWEFLVEELPVDPDDPVLTGDSSDFTTYLLLGGVSLMLFLLLFVTRKK